MHNVAEVRKAMLVGQRAFSCQENGAEMIWILYHTFSRDAMVAVSSKPFPIPIRMPVMLTYLGFLLAFLFHQEIIESTKLAVSMIINTYSVSFLLKVPIQCSRDAPGSSFALSRFLCLWP